MSAKCEWRLSELLDVAEDPFARVVVSSGLRVDLSGSEEQVFNGLRRTLRSESQLFNEGVSCELKDGGQDCLSCAVYKGALRGDPLAPLCRLGRDQRVIEQRLQEIQGEPLKDLAALVEQYMDMGESESEDELLARVP